MRTDRYFPKGLPYSASTGILVALLGLLLLFLGGCSTDSGFLTGGTTADSWCKFYCFEGHAGASANGGTFGGVDTIGEMDSVGLVCHGEQSEAVKLAVVGAGCQSDAQP